MIKNVYKSEEGRLIIESIYKKILAEYFSYPFKQIFIKSKIAKTHIIKFGDDLKSPLVMIHGSVSNSATWLGCITYFIDDFCIYCIDIPGEPGLSEPIRCSLNSEEPYEWLNSVLDCLGIKKTSFLTMSLGSWYALNFAVHNTERIRALSMITTPGIVTTRKKFIYKTILFLMLGSLGQKYINKLIYHKTKMPPEFLEFLAAAYKYFKPVMEELPIFTDDEIENLSFPLQFFGGDCDELIDSVKTAERIGELLPDSEIHILKDTGHVIIDQFPVAREFLISNR